MAGLLEGVLPWIYSTGNTMRRNVRGLLNDPRAFAGSMVQDIQEQNRQRQKDYGLLFQPGVFTTPQEQQQAMARAAQEAVNYVAPTVYHGSPHSFSKFDASKIGTGEGAQAYGHGLYMAENPAVATQYAKDLSAMRAGAATRALNKTGDVDAAMAQIQQEIAHLRALPNGGGDPARQARQIAIKQEKLDELAKVKAGEAMSGPNLYKVDLPDEMAAKMLDWDKPLSQQAPEVRAAFPAPKDYVQLRKQYEAAAAKLKGLPTYSEQFRKTHDKMTQLSREMEYSKNAETATGSDLYNMMGGGVLNQDLASKALAEKGIPGIRYLDQGSRTGGKGTSNYVVFPGGEGLLNIMERNGQPLIQKPQQGKGLLDYQGSHTAPMRDSGAPAYELTRGVYPEDIYSSKAAQYYGHYGQNNPMDVQTVGLLQSLKGRPKADVTIYRAIPAEQTTAERITELDKQMRAFMRRGTLPEGATQKGWYDKARAELDQLQALPPQEVPKLSINAGDWVTVNRAYAKEHGESTLNGKYKIVSKKVKAADIFTNGDSIHEFGYDPQGLLNAN